jgi:hypothetical protein
VLNKRNAIEACCLKQFNITHKLPEFSELLVLLVWDGYDFRLGWVGVGRRKWTSMDNSGALSICIASVSCVIITVDELRRRMKTTSTLILIEVIEPGIAAHWISFTVTSLWAKHMKSITWLFDTCHFVLYGGCYRELKLLPNVSHAQSHSRGVFIGWNAPLREKLFLSNQC